MPTPHSNFPTTLSTATKASTLSTTAPEMHLETALKRTVLPIDEASVHYMVHLQKTWSHNLGFLPRQALERYARLKQGLMVFENGMPAGYLIWTVSRKRLIRVIQVAIEPELLRTTCGTKIMRSIERAASRNDCSAIRLTSMANLPANLFWPELGFNNTLVLTPASRKGIPHLEWTKQLLPATAVVAAYTAKARTRGLRPITGDEYARSIVQTLQIAAKQCE